MEFRFCEIASGDLPKGVAKSYDVTDGGAENTLFRSDFARSNRSGESMVRGSDGSTVHLKPERKLMNRRWTITAEGGVCLGGIHADKGWVAADASGREQFRIADQRSVAAKLADGLGDFPDAYIFSTGDRAIGAISRELRPGEEPGSGLLGKMKSLLAKRDWVARFETRLPDCDVLSCVCASLLLLDITVPADRS